MIVTVFIIFVVIVLFLIIYNSNNKENFNSIASPISLKNNYYNTYLPKYKINRYLTHTNLPWWNTQFGSKRNMLYDIRGNPFYYKINYKISPWNLPTRIPIFNKTLNMVS